MPPLNSLRAWEAAARHASFKKAADELHVTAAAVSHQVKALEAYLGVKLFERKPRGLELTDEARAALPKLQEGFECLAVAVERSRRHAETGALTVSAPPSFGARWLVPRLQLFTAAHPDVDLRVETSMQTIDQLEPATADLASIDLRDDVPGVSIRFGNGHYPGYRVDLLFPVSYVAVCSPSLLHGEHPLRTPADLQHQVLLHDDTIPALAERPRWEEWFRAAGVPGVDTSHGPHFNNSLLALGAAVDGVGVALGMSPLVLADIAAGRLVAPFDAAIHSNFAYFLTCAEAIADRPKVALLRDWLLAEAAKDAQAVRSAREAEVGPSP